MKLFYSPDFYFPLPPEHPFPMRKFPEAREMLHEVGGCEPRNEVLVTACPDEILTRVHEPEYLRGIRREELSPKELRVLGLPACAELLHRSACETEGTRLAARAALEEGTAACLAGGTHHAFPDHGEGFCVLNDVAVAIHDLRVTHPDLRVFVADTDAHQGNGTHAIFAHDPAVFTYSIHVGRNYPSRKVPGDLDVPLERYTRGSEYLDALRETLRPAIARFSPDLIIWISGADPHRNDRFGQMMLSLKDLQERDRYVMESSLREEIPITILYGGGYNREVSNTARIHRNTVLTALKMSGDG
jgi:acetoin utilization deacetylase AcuC-like enzyme